MTGEQICFLLIVRGKKIFFLNERRNGNKFKGYLTSRIIEKGKNQMMNNRIAQQFSDESAELFQGEGGKYMSLNGLHSNTKLLVVSVFVYITF